MNSEFWSSIVELSSNSFAGGRGKGLKKTTVFAEENFLPTIQGPKGV